MSTNALWNVWDDHPHRPIKGTQYSLQGFSIAALRTNFYIPELGVMLDAGLASKIVPEHVFITHGHGDHSANVAFVATKTNSSESEIKKVHIYAPSQICSKINQSILAACAMNSNVDLTAAHVDSKSERTGVDFVKQTESSYTLTPVQSNKTIRDLRFKKKLFDVEVIECTHTVPCVGYGFIERREKLDEKYKGVSQKELGELARSKIKITSEVALPIFCFLGDTSKDVLSQDALIKYPVIMIECTFLDEQDLKQADLTKHMYSFVA